MGFDFYSPFMAAALVGEDGDRVPFWTDTFQSPAGYLGELQSVAINAGLQSLPYVTEIQLVMNLSTLPQITVTLSPPYREALTLLNTSLIEWGRSSLEVQFGYTSGKTVLSPVFSGLMLQPQISLGEHITMTLKGQGGMSLTQGERNKIQSSVTREEQIKTCVRGPDPANARNLEADFTEAKADPNAAASLNETIENLSMSGRSDWEVIYWLCNQCNCFPLLVENKVKIISYAHRLSGVPTKIFSLMDFPQGRIGPESGQGLGPQGANLADVYPILSISTPNAAIYLPGTIRGIRSSGIRSADREAVENFYDDTTARPPLVGTGRGQHLPSPSTPNADEAGDGLLHMYGDVSNPVVKDQINAEVRKLTANYGIKIEVETLGVPDLLPGDVVAIRGMGKRLDGNYGIMQLTHTIGASGYSTRFEAYSNTSKLEAKNTKPASSDPNQKEAEGSDALLKQAIAQGLKI
jgi:hypothetical protein